MKPVFRVVLALFMLVATPMTAHAASIIPAAPAVNAKGYILMDFNSGRVITESGADTRMEPASLTKMMTTYVIAHEIRSGNIRLDDMVRISEKAWRAPGSRMFIEVGKQVSVEELLKGVIVQSGNDASIALAEHAAGSEQSFVSLMNRHADILGMTGTSFVNSTGLPDPDHYTTPRDMAIMAAALIRDFPEHYKWYSIEKYTFNKITQYNRNRLLWKDQYVDGVKTGHTESAGYCLVASALRDGMRLISVVMGTKNESARERETRKLLNYGFRFFETRRLYAANEVLKSTRVWKGTVDEVSMGIARDLFITIPRGGYNQLNIEFSFDKNVMAPVMSGKTLGTLNVVYNGEVISKNSLVALQDIPEAGFWKRIIDQIWLFILSLFS